MTELAPVERVKILLREREELGRPLVFVESESTGPVHVVGPDEDQPGYADVIAALMTRHYRTVCGPVITMTPRDGYVGTFEDERLCRRCGAAFRAVDLEAGAAIFEDNIEEVQDDAANAIYRIQRNKDYEAELAERATGSNPSRDGEA